MDPRLQVRGTEQSLAAGLFDGDTALLAESEKMLPRSVDEFGRMFNRKAGSKYWQE